MKGQDTCIATRALKKGDSTNLNKRKESATKCRKFWFRFFTREKRGSSLGLCLLKSSTHSKLNSHTIESANNRTLGIFFNPWIWWVNIEVPNDSIDKSFWESSGCYPWDPSSESPSIWDSRITMVDFRLYSTSRSHNQAGLYHYAQQQNLSLSLPFLPWQI